ncbi:nucleotidyltransferase family protein [Actinotalea sp. C106]|uniref:nucleotidyltransferase family protein n=1 Tax=Actinotalea sp. C106 TaxID=2908644 RepID=UPI002028387C|nr:nucleotidyltransferase family protein [Actinotalea sp. C106]
MSPAPARHPVVELLVEAVSGAEPPRSWGDEPRLASTDPREVLAVAQAHRLGPTLARHLSRTADLPEGLADELAEIRTELMLRHLTALADLAPVAQALDEADVAWAVVKGPVAAVDLWPHPDMRGYLDLDLLVDPARLPEVIDLLLGLDAEQVDLNWGLIRDQERGELTFILPRGTVLDLHWHLVNDAALRAGLRWGTREVLARRRRVQVGSLVLPTLDRADTLIHLAYHATHSGAYRLLWLKDVAAAWSRIEDPVEVVHRAEAARLDMLVRCALDRAALVLGAEHCPRLPWRSRRGAAWRAVLRGLDRRSAVPGPGDHGRTGRTRFTSVRLATWSSVVALVTEAVGHLLEHRDSRDPEDLPDNPLHEPDGDLAARAEYLATVALR